MAFTKVTGPGIHTLANITSHNINSSGIITATKFVGPLEASSGSTGTFDSLTVTGNVSVGGTLTYEDVTNIDSVGIVTAQNGLRVTAGGINVTAGVSTFTGTIDANGGANIVGGSTLDQVNVTGVSTFAGTIDANGALDVDGQTDLDVLNVAETATFSSLVDVNNRLDVVGGANIDQANVSGISTFGGYISLAQKIIHTGDADTSIEFDTNTIKFETQGAEALRIKSNGFVGIGTDNPTRVVHVQDGSNTLLSLDSTDSNADLVQSDTGGSTRIRSASGALEFFLGGDASSTNATGSGKKLTITSDGNVSIASSLAVTGITTSSSYDLSAIDKSISDTAVDLFVYDTRKDSDGGAWRKRTSHTSWYNETFSATRGSKKEFPAVAVISVIGGTVSSYGSDNGNMKIKIYDGDDPEMSLWMEFEGYSNSGENFLRGGTNYPITSVSAVNGILCIGRDGGYGGALVSFIDEFMYTYWDGTSRSEYAGSIAERNSGKGGTSQAGLGIINPTVNDVAMTVLPNAKIMNGTGLPSPTIAFATIVGATVIKEVGIGNTFVASQPRRVYDTNGSYDNVNGVEFTKDGKVVYTESNGSQYGWMYVHDIPVYKDYGITVNNQGTALSWYDTRDAGSESAQGGHSFADQDGHIYSSTAGYGVKILHTVTGPDDMIYTSTTSGVTMIQENRGANRSSLVAYVNGNYNTGWLHGDQKFCLSDIDDTDKTNTQTEYDRSIGAKNLTAYGTVTKTAVATGAEMVSWSFGNSNSNYLKQDYTAKLQFGTSSFSVMAWIKMADYSSTGFIFDRADSSGGERIAWYMESDDLKLYTHDGSSSSEIGNGTVEIGSAYDGEWVFAVSTRHSSGQMETYINGELRHTQVSTVMDVDNGDAHLIVGGRYNNTSGNQFNGEIALLRMSKSVPSPEQIKKMYHDEKDLFVANAKCKLYGSSSSITALAHDEDTDTLHVGTSGGRSDFTGLNRINNTTTAVTTAISASNGLIIEQ